MSKNPGEPEAVASSPNPFPGIRNFPILVLPGAFAMSSPLAGFVRCFAALISGGGERIRTVDPLLAKQVLSH